MRVTQPALNDRRELLHQQLYRLRIGRKRMAGPCRHGDVVKPDDRNVASHLKSEFRSSHFDGCERHMVVGAKDRIWTGAPLEQNARCLGCAFERIVPDFTNRSEEHTSELQSQMRNSY